jgi:hypothetical protein
VTREAICFLVGVGVGVGVGVDGAVTHPRRGCRARGTEHRLLRSFRATALPPHRASEQSLPSDWSETGMVTVFGEVLRAGDKAPCMSGT